MLKSAKSSWMCSIFLLFNLVSGQYIELKSDNVTVWHDDLEDILSVEDNSWHKDMEETRTLVSISTPEPADYDDYVAVAETYIDNWHGSPLESTIGYVTPLVGPASEIVIPLNDIFNIRRKRTDSLGWQYDIPKNCKPVSMGTANRVTKG
uniref:Uncharacterized protein n=1 Tax=Stomoxys calcitrans TaxID=35570 RepID=A0A1I8P6J5_STOCA